MPELARLAQEVEATKKPRMLTRNNKTVAILMPVDKRKRQKSRTRRNIDYDAFQAAFGSWHDVDTVTLLKNIYADRR